MALDDAYVYRLGEASGVNDDVLEPVDRHFLRVYIRLIEKYGNPERSALANQMRAQAARIREDE